MSEFEDRIRRDLQAFLGTSGDDRNEDVSAKDLVTCPSCGEQFQPYEFNGDLCIGCAWKDDDPRKDAL